MDNKEFSHIGKSDKANMVDVGNKPDIVRQANAEGFIPLHTETIKMIVDNTMKKGEVLSISEFAGIMAAKKTSELIPLCLQLNLTKVEVSAQIEEKGVRVKSQAKCFGSIGVGMEALTSVSISLLTIYNMYESVEKEMQTSGIRLLN